MAVLSKLLRALLKPSPPWTSWGLIVFLVFACAALYVRARDIRRTLSQTKLFEWSRLDRESKRGDKLALIQIAGRLTGNEGADYLVYAISETIEGVDKESSPQQLAVDIIEDFSQLEFDPWNKKFVRKKQIVEEGNAKTSTQTRPADSEAP
jgi:hypothetical protein